MKEIEVPGPLELEACKKKGTKVTEEGSLLGPENELELRKFLLLGYKLRLSFITWSVDGNRYIVTKSRSHRLQSWLFCLFMCVYGLNMMIWYIVKQHRLGELNTDAAIHLAYAGAMIAWSTNVFEFLANAESHADMFNQFLYLKRRYPVRTTKQSKSRLVVQLILRNLRQLFSSQVFTVGSAVAVDVNNTRYTCHYFPSDSWSKLGCAPVEIAFLLIFGFFSVLEWNLFLVAFPIMINVHLENTKHMLENQTDREVNLPMFIHRYRSLYILVQQFSDMMKKNYVIFFIFNVCCHSLSIYTTVDLRSDSEIGGRVVFAIYLGVWLFLEIVVYYVGGKMHENSLELLSAIRRRLSSSCYERKYFAACRPIGIQLGGFVRLKKHGPMLVIYIVSNLTINMLLLKKE